MDAQELKPVSTRHSRLLARLAVAWLAAVLAVGLWQAYGEWLLTGGPGLAR
jgi:hypothetical protein